MSKNRVAALDENQYNLPHQKEINMESTLEQSQHYQLIERAIQYIESNVNHQPELDEIAAAIGLSEYHFQRVFTNWTGISPKRFMQFLTKEYAKELLSKSENLLDTTHQVGLSSLGRLHDLFVTTEAVTPGEYKSGGAGLTIHYGIHATPFGKCLIATTERGICNLSFVNASEGQAIDNLVADWKQARMIEDYKSTTPLITRIFSDVSTRLNTGLETDSGFDRSRENHAGLLNPPLKIHLRGTNFQIKVWEALLSIPTGALTTYEHIARQIGRPKAVRAVGTAVGHNPIAYLIPCHRVIRKSGEFGNYLYGSARKKVILAREYGLSAVTSDLS